MRSPRLLPDFHWHEKQWFLGSDWSCGGCWTWQVGANNHPSPKLLKTSASLLTLALASAAILFSDFGAAGEESGSEATSRAKISTPRATASPVARAKPVLRPAGYTPARRADGRRVVALDIGHTAGQPGALSATGRGEFLFNKDIVEGLHARLKDHPQIFPIVINPKGGPISLPMRTALAAREGAELFLAVHHDSAQDKYFSTWQVDGKPQRYSDEFHGYGVFISQKNKQAAGSVAFARLLGGRMAEAGFAFSTHHNEPIPGENRPILDQDNGVYRYDDLIVLKSAPMPAALLECGVIAHRAEEKLLREPATQAKIVGAVIAAIEEFFAAPRVPSR